MTAEQLARLADLAASAANHFARIDPSCARRFADAALAAVKPGADSLAAESAGKEGERRHGRDLTETMRLGAGPVVA